VADLFVALGVQVRGSFERSANTVYIDEGTGIGDEDLLDLATIQTILNGGTVYTVEPKQVPDHGCTMFAPKKKDELTSVMLTVYEGYLLDKPHI